VLSTGCCMEVMNHYVVYLKPMLHRMLTNWNLNQKLKKKKGITRKRNR